MTEKPGASSSLSEIASCILGIVRVGWAWLCSQYNKAPLTSLVAICGTIIFICLNIILSSENDKAEIYALLDARDAAISARDIRAYGRLIAEDYQDRGWDKQQILERSQHMFSAFVELHMQSFDRDLRLLGDVHAECRQTYRLKARAGKDWRQIVEREQIRLKKTDVGWKISGGL